MNARFETHCRSEAPPSSFAPAPMRARMLQRECSCGKSKGAEGEGAECRNKKRLQPQLTIGASHDPLELEADRVADQVVSAPAHPAVSGARPRIQRSVGQSIQQADIAPASVDRVLVGAGRPLDSTLRQDMEQRFGYDFSQVRVHSDGRAEQSARDVNANAYTVGNDIVFGASRFAPATHDGRRLIAHELTHVLQQTGAAGIRADRHDERREGPPAAETTNALASEVITRHGPIFVQRAPCESLAPPDCDGGTCEEGKRCVGFDWPVCGCWTIGEIERWRRARQPRDGGSGYEGGGGRSGGGGSTDSY